ncbi:hypothetical protein AURDEDRAFT_168940 [Auricularia subglabra TFB-10046 SS5]|nr:hypothetical protein AURDEDRAFT_168940 [Auricularia subglabra TFB-10046 SS5]
MFLITLSNWRCCPSAALRRQRAGIPEERESIRKCLPKGLHGPWHALRPQAGRVEAGVQLKDVLAPARIQKPRVAVRHDNKIRPARRQERESKNESAHYEWYDDCEEGDNGILQTSPSAD